MKLPNGYGSVVKMSGKRRYPYMVRKTAEWHYDPGKDKQVQDFIIIGYAKTKAEGLQMLAEYNSNPYDVKAAKMTFADVFQEWSKSKYQTISASNIAGYNSGYAACSVLHDRIFSELRVGDLQKVIDTCEKNYPTLTRIKIIYNQLYKFAIKNDICSKNYASFVELPKQKAGNAISDEERVHKRLPKETVDLFWSNSNDSTVMVILMLIYNGCRINEFLCLQKKDLHLADRYFDVLDSKTINGIRRVPIAEKTVSMYEWWANSHQDSDTLICTPSGSKMAYDNFRSTYMTKVFSQLGIEPFGVHSTRYTTSSLLAEAGVDLTIRQKILGHSSKLSFTDKVYTQISLEVLLDAINRI